MSVSFVSYEDFLYLSISWTLKSDLWINTTFGRWTPVLPPVTVPTVRSSRRYHHIRADPSLRKSVWPKLFLPYSIPTPHPKTYVINTQWDSCMVRIVVDMYLSGNKQGNGRENTEKHCRIKWFRFISCINWTKAVMIVCLSTSRMLHSVTWRNYFCNLAHFPRCSHTQEIRELLKLKTTTFHILGFCENQLSYLEARQGQACWSQASTEGGSISLLSHFNDTDDHKKRASYIRHGRVLNGSLQKQNKKYRKPQVSCTLPIRWSCSTRNLEPLQGDVSSSSFSTLSTDLWLVLKAGISWDIILQDTSEETLKHTAKNPIAGKEELIKDTHL